MNRRKYLPYPLNSSETLRGDWRENFEFYAKVLDKVEEGNEILGNFDSRISDIA